MLQFTPTMLQRGGECTNRRILEAEKTEFQPSTPFDFYELTKVSKEIPLQGHFLTNPENVPSNSQLGQRRLKWRRKDRKILKAARFVV